MANARKTPSAKAEKPISQTEQAVPEAANETDVGQALDESAVTQDEAPAPVPDDPKVPDVPAAEPDPVVSKIIVAAKREGFRRAGRAWSVTPTTVDVDEFTEGEIDALLGEPMLSVCFGE